MVKNPPANAGDADLIPELGRFPGGGNGNPFQYFCLGNPTDRGAWQAMVHGVTGLGHHLATKPPPSPHNHHMVFFSSVIYRYRCYEYSVESANTSDLREDVRLRSGIWFGFCKIDSRREEEKRNQERRKSGRQRHRAGKFRSCMGNVKKGSSEGMYPLSSN